MLIRVVDLLTKIDGRSAGRVRIKIWKLSSISIFTGKVADRSSGIATDISAEIAADRLAVRQKS